MACTQPPAWIVPKGRPLPPLKFHNTLADKKKTEFTPENGKRVRWYSCGPTVYDASHMGHARNYVTTDILRRILLDYFGYDVTFIMNITDIDDKIIVRARHVHLLEKLRHDYSSVTSELYQKGFDAWIVFLKNFLSELATAPLEDTSFSGRLKNRPSDVLQDVLAKLKHPLPTEDAKFAMNMKISSTASDMLSRVYDAPSAIDSVSVDDFVTSLSDVLAPWLDKQFGAELTDPAICRNLSAYWEEQFLKDMDRLQVMRPNVMTRVTEYVPEIITCIEEILKNGYAYEMEASIYFDIEAFRRQKGHFYAKLCPKSAFDAKLMEEGEGSLSVGNKKRSPGDFALWKRSKPGEPAWDSPWGKGRPGWHIECSAMAADVAPGTLDMHSGGIDLAFPHHDNEIAQSEAQYECTQWVNYFVHTGHLHIEGQKMSKSLKNFVTIDEALQRYSARQMRLFFLLHSWWNTMDYKKEASMKEAVNYEISLINFFDELKALIREHLPNIDVSTGAHFYREHEKTLLKTLGDIQEKVYVALADSFDTPSAMLELSNLMTATRTYVKNKGNTLLYEPLLTQIGVYLTKMFKVFGVIQETCLIGFQASSSSGLDRDKDLLPYLQVLSSFRDRIRTACISDFANRRGDVSSTSTLAKDLLSLCDVIRDKELFDLGVILEDREGHNALVKIVDKVEAQKMREEKQRNEADLLKRKEDMAKLNQAKLAEKQAKAAVRPEMMFRNDPEFSQFDENGIPTHDAERVELTKSKRKKLQKEYEAQVKLYESFRNLKL